MTRKYIILYSHICTYIASFFLHASENEAASCVYESRASYILRRFVVPDLFETDVQHLTDHPSTRVYTDRLLNTSLYSDYT